MSILNVYEKKHDDYNKTPFLWRRDAGTLVVLKALTLYDAILTLKSTRLTFSYPNLQHRHRSRRLHSVMYNV